MTKYKIASNTCVFGSVVLCLHYSKRKYIHHNIGMLYNIFSNETGATRRNI